MHEAFHSLWARIPFLEPSPAKNQLTLELQNHDQGRYPLLVHPQDE
jgi:hypothetical protein